MRRFQPSACFVGNGSEWPKDNLFICEKCELSKPLHISCAYEMNTMAN